MFTNPYREKHSKKEYPGVAQLVAHLTGGQGVVSSSLATRTKKYRILAILAEIRYFFALCGLAFFEDFAL